MTSRFTVIMPMKPWDDAKSRLHVEPDARRALAEAFARDTLEAVLRCPEVGQVVVVTRGQLVVEYVRSTGAHAVQEPVDRPPDALGAAIDHGLSWAVARHPDAPVAVIPSDLPALTTSALSTALRDATHHALAFVADANGDGTTILTSRTPDLMRAGYGPGSAQRHRTYGAYELAAEKGLSQDVDELEDLVAAHHLGLGPRTRHTYADLSYAVSR